MRAQPTMLQTLVNMWDPERKHFVVRDQVLTLEMEDMYFLTGLSHRGATMVLVGGKRGGAERVDDYVTHYCHPGTHKRNNKMSIGQVMDLTLCTILFTITWATRKYRASLGFKEPGGLCSDVFISHSVQLVCNSSGEYEGSITKCRLGHQKQFFYGSILLSFFFEWVPTSCPWDLVPEAGSGIQQ
jgi:hypothetical protein